MIAGAVVGGILVAAGVLLVPLWGAAGLGPVVAGLCLQQFLDPGLGFGPPVALAFMGFGVIVLQGGPIGMESIAPSVWVGTAVGAVAGAIGAGGVGAVVGAAAGCMASAWVHRRGLGGISPARDALSRGMATAIAGIGVWLFLLAM